MFSSTIIPTIGRPALDRAVQSVLEQSFNAAEFEVIVVNDSGKPLAEAAWQQDPRVRIVTTNRRERSVARNTGAALAQGEYLHFLDDDDWIVDGALDSFYALAQTTSAHWLYGRTQLIDRQERPLLQLDHGIEGNGFAQTMAGEWIPLQSSMIQTTAFFNIGGFEPLISGPEDIDLLRRIALHGDLASMDAVVAFLGMGAEGSSTDTARHAERSRWAREKILQQPSVFRRMKGSANQSTWRGRWVRIYVTSALWNLKKGNLLIAISRLLHGLAALVYSLPDWFDAQFWHALATSYESGTFAVGESNAKRAASHPTQFAQGDITN